VLLYDQLPQLPLVFQSLYFALLVLLLLQCGNLSDFIDFVFYLSEVLLILIFSDGLAFSFGIDNAAALFLFLRAIHVYVASVDVVF